MARSRIFACLIISGFVALAVVAQADVPPVGSRFHGYAFLKPAGTPPAAAAAAAAAPLPQPLGELELRVLRGQIEIIYPDSAGVGTGTLSFPISTGALQPMSPAQVRKALQEDDDSYAGLFDGYYVGNQKCPCLILRRENKSQGTDFALMAIFEESLPAIESPLPTDPSSTGPAFSFVNSQQKARGDFDAYLEELKALAGARPVRRLVPALP